MELDPDISLDYEIVSLKTLEVGMVLVIVQADFLSEGGRA